MCGRYDALQHNWHLALVRIKWSVLYIYINLSYSRMGLIITTRPWILQPIHDNPFASSSYTEPSKRVDGPEVLFRLTSLERSMHRIGKVLLRWTTSTSSVTRIEIESRWKQCSLYQHL